jgi:hypothetical protein
LSSMFTPFDLPSVQQFQLLGRMRYANDNCKST